MSGLMYQGDAVMCCPFQSAMLAQLHPASEASNKVSCPACNWSSVSLVQSCNALLHAIICSHNCNVAQGTRCGTAVNETSHAQQGHFASWGAVLTWCLGQNQHLERVLSCRQLAVGTTSYSSSCLTAIDRPKLSFAGLTTVRAVLFRMQGLGLT